MSQSMSSRKHNHPEIKILHAGFHRTGTLSVAYALETLGFGPVWHAAADDNDPRLPRPILRSDGFKWFCNNNFEIMRRLDDPSECDKVDFSEWFKILQCHTIMDAPTILYFEQIFKQYPDVKVICPIFKNDFDKWYKSMNFVMNLVCNSTPMNIIKHTVPVLKMVIDEYYPRILEGNQIRFQNDKKWAKEYFDNRLQRIKQIVPKEQLLVFDVREGWEPLCKFLDVPIPANDVPFPKANSTKGMKERVELLKQLWLKRTIVFLFVVLAVVIAYYWAN